MPKLIAKSDATIWECPTCGHLITGIVELATQGVSKCNGWACHALLADYVKRKGH